MSLKMKYFILKPKSKNADDKYAQASRHAMKAYSNFICIESPELATELHAWQKKEQDAEDAMTIANKPLHQTPKAEPKCTCHPHDLAYYGCRCR